MDKKLLDYLSGQVNAVQVEVSISREQAPNGTQFITIRQPGEEVALYSFWHNPKKATTKRKPKHTGGKKPYIMLMVEEVEKLKSQGVKDVEKLIGHLVCLGNYIEWSTGRLTKGRGKKPLQYKDLLEICGCSNKKLNKMLGEMKEHDLLFGTQEGYFISTRFIKKGKAEGSR